jgi:hypothetical protein
MRQKGKRKILVREEQQQEKGNREKGEIELVDQINYTKIVI